ncbi:MAG: HNH endonuclease, partial [Okeania sp. SIO3H1]|nr:HNH endonuclease [Okeania sp. SIO3H1]
ESDTQKYKLKYILAKLTQYIEEKALGKEKPQSDLNNFLKASIEIEHILPQKPTEEVIKNFDKHNEIKKYIPKLGNLTLLEKSINASVQNGLYSSKIEPYKQSKLYLTKSIVESIQVGKNSQIDRAVKNLKPFKQWTSKSIEERQKILTNLALEVWNMSISE